MRNNDIIRIKRIQEQEVQNKKWKKKTTQFHYASSYFFFTRDVKSDTNKNWHTKWNRIACLTSFTSVSVPYRNGLGSFIFFLLKPRHNYCPTSDMKSIISMNFVNSSCMWMKRKRAIVWVVGRFLRVNFSYVWRSNLNREYAKIFLGFWIF